MYSIQQLKYRLVAAFGIETFCITYGLKSLPLIPFFSFIYFFAGIAIALMLLYFPEAKLRVPQNRELTGKPVFYKLLFVGLLGVVIYIISKYWFNIVPVDVGYADMLPIIRIMGKRFLNGQWKQVYDIIPEIWKGSKPIYLPATWLPFSVSSIFNVDMRWTTSLCVLFVFGTSFFMLQRRETRSLLTLYAAAIAAMLFWWIMTENDAHGFVSISEEGVVAVYYMLLVLAILSGNIYFIGITISLCVLSRYSLIGWIPAFFIYLLLQKKIKMVLSLTTVGIVFFFGLFIIPFGWHAFAELAQLPAKYVDFTRRVWHDSPEVFAGSMGFAKFFGQNNILALHNTLIILSFSVPLLFVIYCYFAGKKRKLSNIPLASLKLGVVFFYNFIDVPYLYLFYTSSFISLATICFFVKEDFANSE